MFSIVVVIKLLLISTSCVLKEEREKDAGRNIIFIYMFFLHIQTYALCLSIYLSIYIVLRERPLSQFIDKHTVKCAPVLRERESGREKRERRRAIFSHSLLRVCSNSHRNSSARAHGRFLSATTRTTARVDTLVHININVDFMFAVPKEPGLLSASSPGNILSLTSSSPALFSSASTSSSSSYSV